LCCVSFVIRTPVSKKKSSKKSKRKRKFREKKRERTEKVEEEKRGCIAVCSLKNSVYIFRFLVIYIPAILYLLSISNHLIFSTIASLVYPPIATPKIETWTFDS